LLNGMMILYAYALFQKRHQSMSPGIQT